MDLNKIQNQSGKYVDYMVETISDTIESCGTRFSGSEGEKKAAEKLAKDMEGYSDRVKIEPFAVCPESFYSWIFWTVTCVLCAIGCYFILPLLSIILLVTGLVPMLSSFVFYRTTFDWMYKKETSHNVTAEKMPTGEVKRAVYFVGHIDAANEWYLNYRFGGKAMTAIVCLAFISMLYIMATSIYRLVMIGNIQPDVAQGTQLYVGLSSLVWILVLIPLFFLNNWKRVVDGANDDLTGCTLSMAVLKALKDNDITFEHTKVGVILTGSEETGLRGAKAWSKAHKAECQKIPTEIISFDTIAELDFLCVNLRDLNMTVKTDRALGEKYMKAIVDSGAKAKFSGIPIGSTDGAAFSQAKLTATSVTAINYDIPYYYHTRRDTIDAVNKDALDAVFKATIEFLKNYD